MLGSVLAVRKDENRALPIESFAISRETTDANSIHYSFFGSSTRMNGLENAAKHMLAHLNRSSLQHKAELIFTFYHIQTNRYLEIFCIMQSAFRALNIHAPRICSMHKCTQND